MFFSTAAQVAVRMETMRKAEAGLIALARRFGEHEPSNYKMELFDTQIPVSVLPFRESSKGGWFNVFGSSNDSSSSFSNTTTTEDDDEEQLTMHAIRVTQDKDSRLSSFQSQLKSKSQLQYPLVIVHGYMNGALYFYRNLIGLAGFFDTVISVDLLGWGLSSRPSIDRLKDESVETAEAFFVESLESWRSTNKIEKMNLAGHSMGGYLSVAYCEKYPERVDQLLLLSPAGIPEETIEKREARRAMFLTSTPRRIVYEFFAGLWDKGYTPGSIMRTITESQGRYLVEGYVRNRLPAITDPEEQAVLAEYMYTGSILPGSGEYVQNRLLEPGAIAKNPCLHRIPQLKVKKISFLYGTKDWMDVQGGLDVQTKCREKRAADGNNAVPNINVYQVRNAGHLLQLENSTAFNAAVMVASGADPSTIKDASDLPIIPRLPTAGEINLARTRSSGSGGVQVTA
jgi:cardiolipin-specific phospholipase